MATESTVFYCPIPAICYQQLSSYGVEVSSCDRDQTQLWRGNDRQPSRQWVPHRKTQSAEICYHVICWSVNRLLAFVRQSLSDSSVSFVATQAFTSDSVFLLVSKPTRARVTARVTKLQLRVKIFLGNPYDPHRRSWSASRA